MDVYLNIDREERSLNPPNVMRVPRGHTHQLILKFCSDGRDAGCLPIGSSIALEIFASVNDKNPLETITSVVRDAMRSLYTASIDASIGSPLDSVCHNTAFARLRYTPNYPDWISGSDYAIGDGVTYNGVHYDVVATATNSTTSPDSDTNGFQKNPSEGSGEQITAYWHVMLPSRSGDIRDRNRNNAVDYADRAGGVHWNDVVGKPNVDPAAYNRHLKSIQGLAKLVKEDTSKTEKLAKSVKEDTSTSEQNKIATDNNATQATTAANKAETHEKNVEKRAKGLEEVADKGGPSLTTHYNAINSRDTAPALEFMGYERQDIATYPKPLNSYDLNIGFSMVVRSWIPSTKPTSRSYNNTNIGYLWAGYINENNHAQIYKSDATQLHFSVTVDGVTQSKYYTGCFDIASVIYFGWDSENLSVYCNGTQLAGEPSNITIATGNQADCCTIGAIKTDTSISSNLKFNIVNFWFFNRELGRDSSHKHANYTLTDAINGVTPPNNYRSGDVDTVDWSDGIALPKRALVSIGNYGAIDPVTYDLITDPDGIGGRDIATHAIKINPTTRSGLLRISPNDNRGDYFVISGWYYAPTGSPGIGLAPDDSMRAGIWLEGDRSTKNQWNKFTVVVSGQHGGFINSSRSGASGKLRLGRFSPSTVPLYFAGLTVTRLGTTIMIGGDNLRIPNAHNQIIDASNNNNPLTIQRYITPTQPGEYGCYTEQGLIINGRLKQSIHKTNYIESIVITNTGDHTITGLDLRTSTSASSRLFSPVNIARGSSYIAPINQSITRAMYYYATSWNSTTITITIKIRTK